jgi:hypothetical protein
MAASTVVDGETQVVSDWLTKNIGGKVVSIARQPRWRPQWIADVERDGETIPLMVRGERYDMVLTWSLEHEMKFQQTMDDIGVLVPKVWGWMDKPMAFVMDRVPGQSDFKDTETVDRDRVVDQYLQQLAHLHTHDVQPFVEAGIDRAASPDESAMLSIKRMNEMFRKQKVGADPQIEFFLGWMDRHEPQSHGREGAVVWDSGQLMHKDGQLVALIDVELGHIGDPMVDLAGWRMRDSIVPFGDFNKIYARYGELVGEPVDIEAIELHHIYFTLSNQLGFSHARLDPPPNSDFATNMQWCTETNLYATEALAEYLGMELPTVQAPDAFDSPAAAAVEHLVRTLSTVRVDDEYARYKLRGAFRIARHIQRQDEIGLQLMNDDLDDLHQLLGKRPEGWREGDRALEEWILANNSDGKHDEKLCILFHRRNLRAHMLNGPVGSAMARHNPIQPFRN